MGLFGKKNKQTTEQCGCGCDCSDTPPVQESEACGCGDTCDMPSATEQKTYNENGEEMAQCDCGGMCAVSEIEAKKAAEKSGNDTGNLIKVLGPGCKKCIALESATKEALKNLNMDTEIDHITDFAEIASYGVMNTPALVVGGKVVSMGKVLKVGEIETLLTKVL